MEIPFQEEISEILIRQVLEENEETGSDKPVRNRSAWSGILLNHFVSLHFLWFYWKKS